MRQAVKGDMLRLGAGLTIPFTLRQLGPSASRPCTVRYTEDRARRTSRLGRRICAVEGTQAAATSRGAGVSKGRGFGTVPASDTRLAKGAGTLPARAGTDIPLVGHSAFKSRARRNGWPGNRQNALAGVETTLLNRSEWTATVHVVDCVRAQRQRTEERQDPNGSVVGW